MMSPVLKVQLLLVMISPTNAPKFHINFRGKFVMLEGGSTNLFNPSNKPTDDY